MRYYNIDLLDLWRKNANGQRKLTPRRIVILIQHLPADSATFIALGGAGWTTGDYLLADIFHGLARLPHPARPTSESSNDSISVKKLDEFKKRLEERKTKLATGEIT